MSAQSRSFDDVDPTKQVATDDNKTSKLEVALKLAKWTILGEFVLFGFSLVTWVMSSLIGSISIADQTIITVNTEGAEKAVSILLPITTGNIGALIGYILGRKD